MYLPEIKETIEDYIIMTHIALPATRKLAKGKSGAIFETSVVISGSEFSSKYGLQY
jgi:hypothetical protein